MGEHLASALDPVPITVVSVSGELTVSLEPDLPARGSGHGDRVASQMTVALKAD
jgi:hypothetical protein